MFYRECERSARGSVISSVKSNIFEVTGESVLMLYGSHLTGAPTSTLLVLSETPLGDAALEALEKSAVSLEFGTAPLAQVVVETDEGKLGAEDVRTIVEGLDPVALVACDAFAAEALSAAYRTPVTLDADNRLLGRTTIIFPRRQATGLGAPEEAAVERPSESRPLIEELIGDLYTAFYHKRLLLLCTHLSTPTQCRVPFSPFSSQARRYVVDLPPALL